MLLIVFSKPLHIPEVLQWVLMVGIFVAAGLMFYFLKQHKLEKQAQPVPVAAPVAVPAEGQVSAIADPKRKARRGLVLGMVLGAAVGLCSPLWMPLTGTTLGWRGDLVSGIVATVAVCAVCGFKLSRL